MATVGGGAPEVEVESNDSDAGAERKREKEERCRQRAEEEPSARREHSEEVWGVLQQYVDLSRHPVVESEVKEVVVGLHESYAQLKARLSKPNILLIGKTGAGKSSLVNAVFGKSFAATGSGEPVTMHLTRYAPEEESVVVYDTRGLEHGNHELFIEETIAFLREKNSASDLTLHIHVVWYVLDMSHSRFQPFEAELCRRLFSEIAIFFILNKVDTSSAAQVHSVTESVLAARIPNCKGVFEVVSDRHNYDVDCCPVCKGENFRFKQKTKEVICDSDECGARVPLEKHSGLAPLIEATTSQLPDWAKHCFITAQEVSEKERLEVAKSIIISSTINRAFTWKMPEQRTSQLTEMASQLAFLWGYRLFPSIITQEVAQHFYRLFSCQSMLERISYILVDIVQNRIQSDALTVVLGVELCRLFCEIKMKAVGFALLTRSSSDSSVDAEAELVSHMDKVTGLELPEELVQRVALAIKRSSVENAVSELFTEKIAIFCTRSGWA